MPHDRQSDFKEDQGDFEAKEIPHEQESVQDVPARESHDRRHAPEGVKLAFEELQKSPSSFFQDIRHEIQAKADLKQNLASDADVISLQVQDDAGVQDEEIRREDG